MLTRPRAKSPAHCSHIPTKFDLFWLRQLPSTYTILGRKYGERMTAQELQRWFCERRTACVKRGDSDRESARVAHRSRIFFSIGSNFTLAK